ncbi:glycosyltransferase family 2 protein [Calidifontibacter terrae]
MTTHRASLVVPTRGGADRLPRLFAALAAQTFPEWEAIVVIDGDIDQSEAVVDRFTHLPIRCIVLPENRGRAAALNTGFEAATGDVVIRCDDDFEPSPGHIGAHVAAHEDGDGGVIGLPLNIAPDNAYMRAYGADADRRSRAAAYAADPAARWQFWGGNTSITRAVWAEVGPFNDRYRAYGWEDVDYGYRIHQAGFPIVMQPAAEVRHHMAAVTPALRAQRAFWSGQARNQFEQLHGIGSAGGQTTPDTPWSRLTTSLAPRLSEARVSRGGRVLDRALPFLPAAIGRKAVALLVESAADAGYRSGPR